LKPFSCFFVFLQGGYFEEEKQSGANIIPGSMRPVGRLIKNIKEMANVRDDSISKRKQSHSIAPAL
jgi:hypothetical protein